MFKQKKNDSQNRGLGYIYSTGGSWWTDPTFFGKKYDQQTDRLLTIKNMMHKRKGHALVSFGGKIVE